MLSSGEGAHGKWVSFNSVFNMKLLTPLLALGAFALATSTTQAAFVWTDLNVDQPVYLSAGQSTSGTFNLNGIAAESGGPVFVAGSFELTSAKAYFAFADDAFFGDVPYLGDSNEYVTVDIYDAPNSYEVDGSHILSYLTWDWITGSVQASLLGTLSSTGELDYTITVTRGDTWFKAAKLKAYGDYKQVPDASATVALMGLGLLGLAAARKRFR